MQEFFCFSVKDGEVTGGWKDDLVAQHYGRKEGVLTAGGRRDGDDVAGAAVHPDTAVIARVGKNALVVEREGFDAHVPQWLAPHGREAAGGDFDGFAQ